MYDIPDMSWQIDSNDVSSDFESKLLNAVPHVTPGDSVSGNAFSQASLHAFDFNQSLPIDVISPFKSLRGKFDIAAGIVVPYLILDTVSYKFGVRQNSTESFTMKGDSVYYTRGVPFYEEFTYATGAGQAFAFTYPGNTGGSGGADVFTDSGNSIWAYSVCLVNKSTGAYKRLFFGDDYTNTANGFTVLADFSGAGYDVVRVTYASSNYTKNYPQNVNKPTTGSGSIPGAVRGLDISVHLGTAGATPVYSKFTGVQTAQVDRRVNLQSDEELGNHHYVDQSYDVPTVSGSLTVKSFDVPTFIDQLAAITAVSDPTIGPLVNVPVPLDIKIHDHTTGTVLKSIHVPDAQFDVPGLQGRANTQLEATFQFSGLSGGMTVYDGNSGF